jgi:RNA polymerase sigma factor (sigma-70 family)
MASTPVHDPNDCAFETVHLNQCVQRWQDGDSGAADELCRAVGQRLEHLARRMLRGYPNVRQWADTFDVYQGAVMRILNTLRRRSPPSTRDFFNLAANHIRCELIDLARRSARRERAVGQPDSDVQDAGPAADVVPVDELELWTRFHEAVEQLSAEEREVFSLAFYHNWTQPRIGELLGVDERTVRRRWQSACLELNRRVGGQLPAL